MCDLTGISMVQVVGKAYVDVINEWYVLDIIVK